MAYSQHRPDLIRGRIGPFGNLTLYRYISGQKWTREIRGQDFLTPMEAAVVLQVHRVTMHGWVSTGVIPSHSSDYGALLRWRDVRKFGKDHGLLPKTIQG